jgi:SAM-dependent methyltransferase
MEKPPSNSATFAPPLSEREYAECFDAFKKISSELDSMQKWLNDDFLPKCTWPESLNILSIGSGDGEFDIELMKIILKRWRIGSYNAVDPNPLHNELFLSRFHESNLEVSRLEIVPEEFPNTHIGKKFDLIHMTQCLYYIPDRARAIQAALEYLNDDGLILIFHQTPQGINEIQRRFLRNVKGDENEMYSSSEIYGVLKSLHVKFDLTTLEGRLDVSDLLAQESTQGIQVLNFFLECRADLLPNDVKQEVIEFIRNLAFSENNRQYLLHPVGVFRVSRSG